MSLSKISRLLNHLETPTIGEKPNQPRNYKFPSCEFGKKVVVKRSFQKNWFSRFPWLHYDVHKDSAFCFICVRAYIERKLESIGNLESTYISTGYTNWKDACGKFQNHEASNCHKDALLTTVTLPATTPDIDECLSSQVAK